MESNGLFNIRYSLSLSIYICLLYEYDTLLHFGRIEMILCGVLPLCLSPWILIKPRIAGEIATSNMPQNATWLLNLDSTWFLSKELHRIVLVDPHLHKAPDVSLKITPFEALENDGYRPNKAYTLPVSTVQVITYDYPWFPNMTGVTSIHCSGSSLGALRVAGGNCPTAEAAGGGLFRSWGPMAKLAAGEGNGKRRFFRIPFRNPSGNIPFISHSYPIGCMTWLLMTFAKQILWWQWWQWWQCSLEIWLIWIPGQAERLVRTWPEPLRHPEECMDFRSVDASCVKAWVSPNPALPVRKKCVKFSSNLISNHQLLTRGFKKRPILQQKQFQPSPFGRTSTGSRV